MMLDSIVKKKEFASPAKQLPKRTESEVAKPKKSVKESSTIGNIF
jgi:hypothetical protein